MCNEAETAVLSARVRKLESGMMMHLGSSTSSSSSSSPLGLAPLPLLLRLEARLFFLLGSALSAPPSWVLNRLGTSF